MADKEKVKVSLFLEPQVARAVKVQAARQGEGVSQLVGRVFQCAHCRDPIMGEFAVGLKAVAPGRFGVFFHADRKECYLAGGVAPKKASR